MFEDNYCNVAGLADLSVLQSVSLVAYASDCQSWSVSWKRDCLTDLQNKQIGRSIVASSQNS